MGCLPKTILVWLLLTALGGCGEAGVSPKEAAALAESRREAFLSFERWTKRVLEANPAFPSNAAQRETLFAPLVLDRELCAVWIRRDRLELSYPDGAEMESSPSWTRIRLSHEGEGELEVASGRVLGGKATDSGSPCVMLRRVPRERRELTMAFVAENGPVQVQR